ncbi:MAG: arylsulfatase [Cyclobacteriaceae bacterium]|nr:arylsulfatase [Cyclobacteriaceae bacterium]
MHKILFYLLAMGLLSVACGETDRKSTEEALKPNIIYILADDLGYHELGCYGQKEILTPKIDQLAREGVRFTRHYAGTSVCAPSRSVLMTGLHTGHTPSRGNMEVEPYGQFQIPDKTVTVAELLKNAGYSTALFGKWGLGVENTSGDPQKQGFNEFFGYYGQVHAHNAFPEYLYQNGQKVPLKNEVTYLPRDHWTRGLGSYSTTKVDYSNDLFAEKAIEFIAAHADQPFFLYLPVTIPHNNGEAPEGLKFETPTLEPYEDRDWSYERKSYAAMITRLDTYAGKIMEKLRSAGIDQRTLVIFTSDNGSAEPQLFNGSGELRGMKRDLYEGGIRVPMIAWWPGTIEPGRISDHVSAFWDVLPTFCDLAGTGIPDYTDGISFLPELKGNTQPRHEYLYWEFHEQGKTQAALKGKWKALRLDVWENPQNPIELYDLQSDPGETINVAGQHPEVVGEMMEIIREAHVPDPNWPLYEGEF